MLPSNKSLRPSLRSDSPQAGIRAVVRICVCVTILGPSLWALIYLGLLNRGAGPKVMAPTMPSFF